MSDLRSQYKNADNLNIRISIHNYSTNKQGFGNWIASQYEIHPGSSILELGCGTGYIWKNWLHLLRGSTLALTDFSEGMLESAKSTLGTQSNLSYSVVDIQSIPYRDNSFDVVIANMMLYHVPDLAQGLSEVRRVLKPDGRFYCATYGEHGISEYIADLLREQNVTDRLNTAFTLQNGATALAQHFSHIKRLDYTDSLEIPDLEAFADYVFSLSSLDNIENLCRDTLINALNARTVNGILHIPKEYGMFICS